MTATDKNSFVARIEQEHGQGLRRFLASKLRNRTADVPDLAQEIFLRLLRIQHHETIRDPQAYLYTIASHVLHQHSLRLTTQPATVELLDAIADLQSVAEDPAAELEIEQRYEKIGHGLEELSPRAYATLLMHRCDGIPLEEIAARFGVSYSMVKKYLAKALAYCQQQLQETSRE